MRVQVIVGDLDMYIYDKKLKYFKAYYSDPMKTLPGNLKGGWEGGVEMGRIVVKGKEEESNFEYFQGTFLRMLLIPLNIFFSPLVNQGEWEREEGSNYRLTPSLEQLYSITL